jgi:lysozyme
MELNQAGINLIKSFESCRLEAYPDPGTGGDPWTIGHGHTGPEVHEGLVWTQEQADEAFVQDSQKFCSQVSALVPDSTNSNQFSACVSLAYNIGISNFSKSLLLRCMQKNNWNDAAKQFMNWTKAAGKVLPGLVKRREAEMALFQS